MSRISRSMSSGSVSPESPSVPGRRVRGASLAAAAAPLLLWTLACGPSRPATLSAVPAEPGCPAASPDGSALAHVRYLAADALEGREVGSAGERCTTAYLAARFAELGLLPAGAGDGWYQAFPVRSGSTLTGAGGMTISGDVYEQGKAWEAYGFSGSGEVTARLVYIGPGVSMPGRPEDQYAGVDVEGAIAVVERDWEGVAGFRAEVHFRSAVAEGRRAAALLVLMPEDASLPRLDQENRPFVDIPVVAVAGEHAATVREAARQGGEATMDVGVAPRMVDGRNVAAVLPGADPVLADEWVVVGAHHDHLGRGGEGSLAPSSREIHNGADDNASGTAALIEIAERLLEGPRPARSVLFLGLGGEERGLLGSAHYVEHPLRPLESTVAMINLDMVGRLEDGPLTVFGMATAVEWETLVRDANATIPEPMELTLLPDGFGPSDHAAFYGKGIPVLHLFTGTHADYHRPSDDWQAVDGPGVERVSDLTAAVTRRLAGTSERVATALTPLEGAGAAHGVPPGPDDDDAPTTSGYGPYFGSIPDMTPQDFGVRLTGVGEGSPAQLAGLQEGDVVVEFGGQPVADLYAYTYALQAHAPGDVVEVVVVRGGERMTFTATLTERP